MHIDHQACLFHVCFISFKLQIDEDDVTNAAYGSEGSFFASDTVSIKDRAF